MMEETDSAQDGRVQLSTVGSAGPRQSGLKGLTSKLHGRRGHLRLLRMNGVGVYVSAWAVAIDWVTVARHAHNQILQFIPGGNGTLKGLRRCSPRIGDEPCRQSRSQGAQTNCACSKEAGK